MSVLLSNEPVTSFLNQIRFPSEIHDAQGNLLGVFTPFSLINPKRTYTTKEVFYFLKFLTSDPALLADLDRHIAAIEARDRECDAR